MWQNYYHFFFFFFGAAVLLLFLWLILLEWRLKKLFRGTKAKDLEEIIRLTAKEADRLDKESKKLEEKSKELEKKLAGSIQKVGIIRFNPFKDSGSNQSFSIALLDEKGNGIALSALYSREKTNVYAKPIKNYSSEYPLSDEEQEAIDQAKRAG